MLRHFLPSFTLGIFAPQLIQKCIRTVIDILHQNMSTSVNSNSEVAVELRRGRNLHDVYFRVVLHMEALLE